MPVVDFDAALDVASLLGSQPVSFLSEKAIILHGNGTCNPEMPVEIVYQVCLH
jgi:hypothetical protein